MRLSPDEIAAIKRAARDAFGETVVVRLFGSRVEDGARGGDIDLHFEVDREIGNRELDRFEAMLFARIDEQKVDKVFTVRGSEPGRFERICYRDGIVL